MLRTCSQRAGSSKSTEMSDDLLTLSAASTNLTVALPSEAPSRPNSVTMPPLTGSGKYSYGTVTDGFAFDLSWIKIARPGQTFRQLMHPVHLAKSTCGMPLMPSMVMASNLQALTHGLQGISWM